MIVVPPDTAQRNGYNAVNAMNFTTNPGAIAKVIELKAGNPNFILRDPGGTLANYVHITGAGYGLVVGEITDAPQAVKDIQVADGGYADNHLARRVQFMLDCDCAVTVVVNMLTGTIAEAIATVQAFVDGGVPVKLIELGNEWYLPRYVTTYPDHVQYIADAKDYRDALKAQFPTIPVGIVVCPSADMGDPDSGTSGNVRKAAANDAFRLLTWPDYYVLHCYAGVNPAVTPYNTSEADAVCAAHRVGVKNCVDSFPDKPFAITEWNVFGGGAGGTLTQTRHYTAMRAYFLTEPRILIQTMHSLFSGGTQYNAILSTGGGSTFTPLGDAALDITPPITGIDPNAAPSATGLAAKTTIEGNGGTVYIN